MTYVLGTVDDYKNAVLADNPVAYYRLHEASGTVATDSSGNGNHATIIGKPGFRRPGPFPGLPSFAMRLQTGTYIQAALTAGMRAGENVAVEWWALIAQMANVKFVARDFASSWRVDLRSDGRYHADAISGSTDADAVTSSGFLMPDRWDHYVMAYAHTATDDYAAKTLNLLRNGEIIATGAVTLASIGNTASTGFFRISDSGSGGFIGDMTEVAYYAAPLPVARAKAHFEIGKTHYAPAPLGVPVLRRYAPVDAAVASYLHEIDQPVRYMRQRDIPLYIGEFAYPDSTYVAGDGALWNIFGEQIYQYFDAEKLPVTWWDAGRVNYPLSVYRPSSGSVINYAAEQHAVVGAHLSTSDYFRGVNLSRPTLIGGGWSTSTLDTGVNGFSMTDPGTAYWETTNDLIFIQNHGVDTVRAGFLWERIQAALATGTAGALGNAIAQLDAFIDRCTALGIKVILNMHNFGALYLKHTDNRGKRHLLNVQNATTGITVTSANFANVWHHLSLRYKDNPTVIAYGLMNEPYLLTVGNNVSNWFGAAQAAIDAIRANGDSKWIWVSVTLKNNAIDLQSFMPTLPIRDPLNRWGAEYHGYPDDESAGSFTDIATKSYAATVAARRTTAFR